MVYSSDFYTSRRPAYYKPSTSYSVTPMYSSDGYDLPPTYYKAHQVYQTCTTPIPFILTPTAISMSSGRPFPNVLPYNGYPYYHHHYLPLHRRSTATIHGVLDRIEHRPRSHPSYDPTDEYLNSKSAINFDDVTRDIRAQTAGLLKQVYTPTIRPKLSSVSNGYSELPIAKRIESDAYIEKILADSDLFRRENNIGTGHLACVSYAGGRAYPRRRPHLSKEVDDNITMLSYYNKTREAVESSATYPKVNVTSTENCVSYSTKKVGTEHRTAHIVRFDAEEGSVENEALKLVSKEKAAAKLTAEEEETAKLAAKGKEATKLAAKEAARLAAEEEITRLAAAEEAAKLIAEEKAAAKLAAEKITKLDAEEEATRLAAEEEAARLAAEEEAAKLANEEEAARLAAEEETRLATEKKLEETDEASDGEEIEESEQKIDVSKKTITNFEFETQKSQSTALAESSTITETSTKILNGENGEVKTTAVFQRTITKTTTVTSSTSVSPENDNDDDDKKIEIHEIIEEDSDNGEDEYDETDHQDAAQAEGQESSEEVSEDEDESEEE